MLARAEVVCAQTRRGVSPRGVCRPCAARARASTVAASRGGLAVLELGLERGLRLKGLRRGLRASAAALQRPARCRMSDVQLLISSKC